LIALWLLLFDVDGIALDMSRKCLVESGTGLYDSLAPYFYHGFGYKADVVGCFVQAAAPLVVTSVLPARLGASRATRHSLRKPASMGEIQTTVIWR